MDKEHYNRIKVVLAEKRLTNKKLAQALGITVQTVSRWCTNEMQPSIETLYRIAAYLDIDVRELLMPTKD
jgi:transcriptional regulator with XRE-family HTH domain